MCFEYRTLFILIALLGCGATQQFIGDVCSVKPSGAPGVCQLFSKCAKALEELQKRSRFPQTCGFQGSEPIVCCPKPQRKPGEISKTKCKEYSKYVYEIKPSPILLIDNPIVRRNECGQKVVKLVIGGEPAGRKEFPHMAAVGYEEPGGEIHWLCGGTILSERFILTAAHCLHDGRRNLSVSHVRLGVVDITNTVDNQDIKVAELIAHPEYRYPSNYHDIGLLKLEKAAVLNSYARPACLYTRSEISAEKAIATGWGDTTSEGFSKSNHLMKVLLNFVDNDECNTTFKGLSQRRLSAGIVDDFQICAGSDSDQPKDTCQGDSGGPLQIFHAGDDIQCMYDIVGITSFGKICSTEPGVYVRVSNYNKWIEDIVWPDED